MLSRWATGPDLLGIVTGAIEDSERGQAPLRMFESSDPSSIVVCVAMGPPFFEGCSRWRTHREGTGEQIIGGLSLKRPVVSSRLWGLGFMR